MKFFPLAAAGLLLSLLSGQAQIQSVPKSTTESTNAAAGLSDADKAWKEVEKATRPPMPPAEWQGQRPTEEQVQEFRSKQGVLAGEAADKAKDFYTRFPEHSKAEEARKREYQMLQFAVYLGNTNRETALQQRQEQRLKDPNLSEDERFELRAGAIQQEVMRSVKPDDEAAMWVAQEKGARKLIKEFPKREEGYQWLLQIAGELEPEKGRAIAKDLAQNAPSDELKKAAEGLLGRMDALGKPVEIKFTAVDGREVDVSKLHGKVVLIDFWATWCGPCVAEVPNVVKTYEKLHPKGFEIVGISFDSDKEKLKKFTADKEMPWPQFFDGKTWQNKFGVQYGINSIPTMWLVDKKGNLRDMSGRNDLETKVQKLLAE